MAKQVELECSSAIRVRHWEQLGIRRKRLRGRVNCRLFKRNLIIFCFGNFKQIFTVIIRRCDGNVGSIGGDENSNIAVSGSWGEKDISDQILSTGECAAGRIAEWALNTIFTINNR